MKRKHALMFFASVGIYILFVLRGLSTDHYQNLRTDFIICDNLEIFIWLVPACMLLLKAVSEKQNYFRDSFRLTFYTTVVIAVYDSIFLGVIKGFGLSFFSNWWFLTLFYFILWVEFPVIGYLMQADDRNMEKKHFLMLLIAVFCCLINFWEGLDSSHFQEWTLDMKIMRLTNVPLLLLPVTYFFLRHCSDRKRCLTDSCFLALYMSFVFFLFDFHYLAIVKGHGIKYLLDYWFVTLFYPVFWIVIPATGLFMKSSVSFVPDV